MHRDELRKSIREAVSDARIRAHDVVMLTDTTCPNADHIESLAGSVVKLCSAMTDLLDMMETGR